MDADAIVAAEPIVAAAAPIVAAAAPNVEPPSYDIDYDTATAAIGTLPSLHPRPSHANIRALERDLFEKLETLQSTQSEEWGFRGLAEQPAEYALKSVTPWVHSPNPGQHRPLGLAAGPTRDAEAVYLAEKSAYQAQATVTRAIIAALNVAVPKAFRRGATAVGGALIGAAAYRSNHDPRAILLALRTTYGIPSPAERNANDAAFAAPWNTSEPIETYFDRLEDCYVAAIIASPPFTMEQMMTRAIMAIQLTGLYSQALIEWNGTVPATRTWDALKVHFTTAYIVREQSGTGSTGANGYHTAANSIAHDDAINNMESTLAHELTSMQTANNANHQSALAMIAALQQQLALLTVTPGATATPTAPPAPMYAPAYSNHQRYNGQGNGGRFTQGSRGGYRGNRGGAGRNNYAPTPLATATPTGGIPPAPAAGARNNPPNRNKWYNNMNYCYSCGYDVPIWHTSLTCNYRNHHHQEGCTRANVAAYKAAGHATSDRNQFRTIMPTQPTAEQA
jgi:hypothetical protein